MPLLGLPDALRTTATSPAPGPCPGDAPPPRGTSPRPGGRRKAPRMRRRPRRGPARGSRACKPRRAPRVRGRDNVILRYPSILFKLTLSLGPGGARATFYAGLVAGSCLVPLLVSVQVLLVRSESRSERALLIEYPPPLCRARSLSVSGSEHSAAHSLASSSHALQCASSWRVRRPVLIAQSAQSSEGGHRFHWERGHRFHGK